jgi:hypothetical protein
MLHARANRVKRNTKEKLGLLEQTFDTVEVLVAILMPLICMAVDKSIESLKCYTLTLKNKSMIKRNYVYMDTVEGLTVMHVPLTCMAICHL